MTNWSDILGDFPALKTNGFINNMGKFSYLTILTHIEDIFDNSGLDENPYNPMFETLQQALNPRIKGEKKYTYEQITKNNIKVESPIKKFTTISNDTKYCLTFLLNLYMQEVLTCYNENDKIFNENFISQLVEYSENGSKFHFISSVIKSCDLLTTNENIYKNYNKFDELIISKIKPYFTDKHNIAPEIQLNKIVYYFINFTKLILILITNILWEKRQSVNISLFAGILQQISSLLIMHQSSIDNEIIYSMKKWVEACHK